MIENVKYDDGIRTVEAPTLVIKGLLFQWNEEKGFCCCLCERTVGDYGMGVEQFRSMVESQGLKAMLGYYPDAFLHVGQNRYIRCELIKEPKHDDELIASE